MGAAFSNVSLLQDKEFKRVLIEIGSWRITEGGGYVSPVANRHNANATRLCIGIDCRSLVSCLTISGPTKRTIQSNVCLDILNFFLHHSSTKALFKRLSNYN